LLPFISVSFVFLSPNNLKNKLYETIILYIVLYGCETWSLTQREHRMRVLKNRMLRIISGSKREGSSKKLEKTA
jgi:hypothetical protein